MTKTTLILGAGASCKYGYPSGAELVDIIIQMLSISGESYGLRERLMVVRPDSIDQFISENKDLRKTLLGYVAEAIVSCEMPEMLYQVDKKDDFYRALFNSIPLENYKNIQIITFNYDRSLEYALYKYLQFKLHNKQPEVISKFNELKIHHVYGRMLPLPFEDANESSEYGTIRNSLIRLNDIRQVDEHKWKEFRSSVLSKLWDESEKFQIVYDEHKVDEVAKGMIEEATRILFLGFSYHPLNLLKLGYDFTRYSPLKVIAGTVLGMSGTKQRQLVREAPAIHYLQERTIIEFLKEDFDLSNSQNDIIKPEGVKEVFAFGGEE